MSLATAIAILFSLVLGPPTLAQIGCGPTPGAYESHGTRCGYNPGGLSDPIPPPPTCTDALDFSVSCNSQYIPAVL